MQQELHNNIKLGLEQVAEYKKTGILPEGAVIHDYDDLPEVKTIREKLQLTQEKFAEIFGFSKSAVCHWEAGRRTPEKSARAYLKLIEKDPVAVLKIASS